MMKAGLIEEMVEDAFSLGDSEEVEEAADEEVEKVIAAITKGELDKIGNSTKKREVEAPAEEVDEDDEKEETALKNRLGALNTS